MLRKLQDHRRKTIKIFPDAIKQETDLLVRIDDIVAEISMIKRVHQDQDHVCVSMRIYNNQRNPNDNTVLNGRAAMEKGMNELRSPSSQHVMARLERLEEDASRVRKSVSCLLSRPFRAKLPS